MPFYDDQSLNVALEQYGMRYVRSIFKDYYNNIWLAFSEGGVGSINASTGKFTRLDYPEKVKGNTEPFVGTAMGTFGFHQTMMGYIACNWTMI